MKWNSSSHEHHIGITDMMSYSHGGGIWMDIKQAIVEIRMAKDVFVLLITSWTVWKKS